MKGILNKQIYVIFIGALVLLLITSVLYAGNTEDGAKEGITIHGHWKIEIFNPDGTRVSVTEFENAIVTGGQESLVDLLTGSAAHGAWGIELSSAVTNPCDDSGNVPCRIGESGIGYSVTIHSTDLTVSDNGTSFTLSGSVPAAYASSSIETVMTKNSYCDGTRSPNSCTGGFFAPWRTFTSATLGPPPSVLAGQVIQVTVTISIS